MNQIPDCFQPESCALVYRIRRQVEHIPSRFQLMRIAEHIRRSEWEASQASDRARTRAASNRKAAATRERNRDPFGFEAMRLPCPAVLDGLYAIHLSKPLVEGQVIQGFEHGPETVTSHILAELAKRTRAADKRRREDNRARKGSRSIAWRDPWDTLRA